MEEIKPLTTPLFLIVGKSGCGKTTIVNRLEKYGLKTVQSYTTRSKRNPDESSHIFISDGIFKNLENIVAETFFNNHHYGATQEQVDRCSTYVIDLAGIEYFKTHYKTDRIVKVIQIKSPKIKTLFRLLQRDGLRKTISRIINDMNMFKNVGKVVDVTIHNNKSIEYITYDLMKLYSKLIREGDTN